MVGFRFQFDEQLYNLNLKLPVSLVMTFPGNQMTFVSHFMNYFPVKFNQHKLSYGSVLSTEKITYTTTKKEIILYCIVQLLKRYCKTLYNL